MLVKQITSLLFQSPADDSVSIFFVRRECLEQIAMTIFTMWTVVFGIRIGSATLTASRSVRLHRATF